MEPQEVRTRLEERKRSLVARRRLMEQEVEEAWDRLDRGQYGFCENCNRPIETDRLEFRPESKYCRRCDQENMVQSDPGAQAVS